MPIKTYNVENLISITIYNIRRNNHYTWQSEKNIGYIPEKKVFISLTLLLIKHFLLKQK